MDPTTVPVFDFHTPWVAVIQLVLLYVLPRLTGLVTDRLTASLKKVAILGVLSVVGSGLTWLLDVAVSNTWASFVWTDLINIVVNASLTFFFANTVYDKVIKPSGAADADAMNTTIKLFGASPAREYAENRARAASQKQAFAVREAIGKADSALAAANVAKAAASVPIARKAGKVVVNNTTVNVTKPASGVTASERSARAKKAAATRKANAAAKASL
jgi:hypothetical protein